MASKLKITVKIDKMTNGRMTTRHQVFKSTDALKRALSFACGVWRDAHESHSGLVCLNEWAECLVKPGTVCLEQVADDSHDTEIWTIMECEKTEAEEQTIRSACIEAAEAVEKARRMHKLIPWQDLGMDFYKLIGTMTPVNIGRAIAELGTILRDA